MDIIIYVRYICNCDYVLLNSNQNSYINQNKIKNILVNNIILALYNL